MGGYRRVPESVGHAHSRNLAGHKRLLARHTHFEALGFQRRRIGEFPPEHLHYRTSVNLVGYAANFGQVVVEPKSVAHVTTVPEVPIEEVALEPGVGTTEA